MTDVPVIVNCLFSKWLLIPLCMLNVATQYKMLTERLVTVSMLSGQINSRGKLISDIDSHNFLHVHISPPYLSIIV